MNIQNEDLTKILAERSIKNKKKIQKYKRPEITITDAVQNREEIIKQLDGYVEIKHEELDDMPRNTYLKYLIFSKEKNKELFRFGGKLIVTKERYIVLKGKRCTFSVQKYIYHNNNVIYNTRFFKKKNKNLKLENKKLKKELNKTIDKANNMFVNKSMLINQQKEKINNLKRKILKIKNKYNI